MISSYHLFPQTELCASEGERCPCSNFTAVGKDFLKFLDSVTNLLVFLFAFLVEGIGSLSYFGYHVLPKQTRSGTRLTKSEEDRIPILTKDLFNVRTYLEQEIIVMLDYRDTISHKYTIDT